MKLAIDARESGTTTGRYVDKLIEYLHKLSPEFEVVLLAKDHRHNYLKSIAPNFKTVSCNYPEFSFAEQLGYCRQIYGLKADLVHFTLPQQPVLYFGKTITTMHDLTTVRFTNPTKNWLVFKIKQFVYRGVIIWAAKKSKAIMTISEFVKQDLVKFTHVPASKINVAYLAADKIADAPEPVKGVNAGNFIMYVGRPLPHKNLWRLVEAFAELKASHPQLQLVLAGKKDDLFSNIESRAQKAGINDVVFTDFVSEGQLRWLYENTAAYIFPSLSEGFGLPGLEAMVHGAPVVSSNATCLPEIYGDAAHYFDPLSPGDMAAKINDVLIDSELRQQLIKNGKTQAAKFSWEKLAEQTLAVYKKFIN